MTRYLTPIERTAAFRQAREEIAAGRQVFVICPLVEGSQTVESRAATEEYERLRTEEFPDLGARDRILLLHGRMASKEKDRVMRAFADHEADILVSTAVVEVGIDVPNATVMFIHDAGRFGLAQLHQLRGRIGRGAHTSYCVLFVDDKDEENRQRLAIDHEVPALRVEAPDGTPKAVLFGYACHNTSLGFYNWCGDYAGFAQEYLQEHRPDFTALFLMGCGGDRSPRLCR